MIEHGASGHTRINAEILRQIAQRRAQGLGILEDIDITEGQRALIRCLQGGNRAHQRGLARPVGPQQSEHPVGNGQADAVERAYLIAVSLCQSGKF